MSVLLGLIMFISPMALLVVDSWMMIWLFLELSSMSFIMYMIYGKLKTDWTLVYFLIQSLGSVFLLFSFMSNEMSSFVLKIFGLMLLLISFSVLLKIGMFPFHFWVLKMSLSLNFKELKLLLIIQKIAPLWVLTSFLIKGMIIISLLGLFMSTLMQFSMISAVMLMIFSSISHMSWMLVTSMKFLFNMMVYFFFYSIILFLILSYFYKFKTMEYFISFGSKSYVLVMGLMVYSLAGMPLLLGFMPKWLVFYCMMEMDMYYPILVFILLTGMNFYIYNRLMYNFFLMGPIFKTSKKKFFLPSIFIINLFFPFNLLMI